mgnify:CR=1 FL=1
MNIDNDICFEKIYSKNKLFIDYINRRNDILNIDFTDQNIYENKINELYKLEFDFYKLSKILINQNEELLQHKPYWNELQKKITHPPFFTVVTGQQPGLLGGPNYTLFKVLTCIKLAKWIEDTFKISCLPIFWLVSEDHDIQETTSLNIINKNWDIIKIKETIPQEYSNLMINCLTSNSNYVSFLINGAKNIMPLTLHTDDIITKYFKIYQSSDNIATAFKKFLSKLLDNLPILFIDPSCDEVKQIASSLFIRFVEDFTNIHTLLKKQTNIIIDNGYTPQLKLISNQLPFFYIIESKRYPLLISDEIYIKNMDRVFPKKDFMKILKNSPNKISANVISRPLIQDLLLPNITYVVGAAEISYLTQIKPLYAYLNIPMPIFFPRHSATIIFTKIKKYLTKLKISPIDIMLNKKLSLHTTSQELINKHLDTFQKAVIDQYNILISDIKREKIDITNEADLTKSKIINIIDRFKSKCSSKFLQQNSSIKHSLEAIKNTIKPFNKLQERELTIINLLNLEGEYSIKSIYNKIDLFNAKHYIYEI